MMRRAVTGLLAASVAVCAEAAGLTGAPSTGQLTVFALDLRSRVCAPVDEQHQRTP
jgi:hypothetical protein